MEKEWGTEKFLQVFWSSLLLLTFMVVNYFIIVNSTINKGLFLCCLMLCFFACKKDDYNNGPSNNPPVNNPVILGINPTSGPKGTNVTIVGSNFTDNIQEAAVFINGKQAIITYVSKNSIHFIVPPKSGSGLVGIVVNGKAVSGPLFEYEYTVTISAVAGQPGIAGFADGNFSAAKFNSPRGITIDAQGNIYVADELNHRIRRVSPGGSVATFAGMGTAGFQNGAPGVARFNSPYDIDVDAINGFFYVADKLNHCIRRLSLAGDVTVAAGIPGIPGYVDAAGL